MIRQYVEEQSSGEEKLTKICSTAFSFVFGMANP